MLVRWQNSGSGFQDEKSKIQSDDFLYFFCGQLLGTVVSLSWGQPQPSCQYLLVNCGIVPLCHPGCPMLSQCGQGGTIFPSDFIELSVASAYTHTSILFMKHHDWTGPGTHGTLSNLIVKHVLQVFLQL